MNTSLDSPDTYCTARGVGLPVQHTIYDDHQKDLWGTAERSCGLAQMWDKEVTYSIWGVTGKCCSKSPWASLLIKHEADTLKTNSLLNACTADTACMESCQQSHT